MSIWTDFLGAEIYFLETPGFGRVRIAEAGKGKKEILILMHGTAGHLETYAKNLMSLAEDFHVIAYDFYGCGLSERRVIDFTPKLLADQLAVLMDVMGIEKAHLSGESLGGMVAAAFAVKHPRRVMRLMLNTTGGLPITTEKGRQEHQALCDLISKVSTAPPTYESIYDRMKWLMHPSNWHLLEGELVESRLKIYTQPDAKLSGPAIAKFIIGLESFPIELEKIQAETMILWTRDNPINNVDDARVASTKIPRAKLHVMEADGAHWPQYEAPEEFNRVTRDFFLNGLH